jgi:hypothetical protein
VTEPTLSGTDVLRQLLTFLRHTPSRGEQQAVKKIVISAAITETKFTQWFQ